MAADPWLLTQVRRRASQIVEDWAELDALILRNTDAPLMEDDEDVAS